MSTRARWLLVVLGVVVVAALFVVAREYWFEQVEEEIDLGLRGEAAVNDLLALQELCVEMGLPTESVRGVVQLPPTDHVLVLAPPTRSIGPGSAERIVDWVHDGGHLVVTVMGSLDHDALLDALEVAQVWEHEEVDELVDEGEAAAPESTDVVEAMPEEDAASARRPDWPRLLHYGGADVVRSDGPLDGARILTVGIGDGHATVLNDGAFLGNDAIGEGDNALVAWRALVIDELPAGAWLVFRDLRPSAWALLASRARPATIAFVVTMIAILWRSGRRFGPVLEPATVERRSLTEHVRAAGVFLWANGAGRLLLDAEREALRQRLTRGHDGGNETSLARLAEAAADAAELEPERVIEAVEAKRVADPRQFTRVIRILENLRRAT